MTDIINGIPIIYTEEPQKCELCGKIAETRPYGKNGEEVCFECGMKDIETTKWRYRDLLFEGKRSSHD